VTTTPEVDRDDAVQSRKGAWHQSGLQSLLDGCSWQWWLQYEMNLPTVPKAASVVGVAYHAVLEAHEQARMDGQAEGLGLKEMQAMAADLVLAEIDDDELVTVCKAAIKHWYSAKMKDGSLSHRDWLMQHTPVALEPYFRLLLVDGAMPVAGWIDGVYRDGQTGDYFLIDHKTARKLDRWHADGDGHRNQATMYSVALAMSPDFPEITDLIPMVYLVSRTMVGRGSSFEPARRVTVTPDYNDVAELGARIRKAEQIREQEAYTRRPEWNLCSAQWCPFYEGCMVTGELAGTPQSVRLRLA
jgi:CRISPR/Cas system-associated exonuclease Cas4 (RecB family)